jgi:hypothetical protein
VSAAFVATVLGCVGIGAWLVVQGHPWFGLLSMLIGSSVRLRKSDGEEKEP